MGGERSEKSMASCDLSMYSPLLLEFVDDSLSALSEWKKQIGLKKKKIQFFIKIVFQYFEVSSVYWRIFEV